MIFWIINIIKEFFDSFFHKENGVKQLYLVRSCGEKRLLSVGELKKPYDHMEIEFVYNNKTYTQVVNGFHRIHDKQYPIILSAILNDHIDITDHVNKYLINDLSYLQVKHVIPAKYISSFDNLEILDEDCNSLIYRKLTSRLDFLEPLNDLSRERYISF